MGLGVFGAWWAIVMVFTCFCTAVELETTKLNANPCHSRKERAFDPCRGIEEASVCKIINFGQHPWIIRFKFDVNRKLKSWQQLILDKHVQRINAILRTVDAFNHRTLMTGVLISPTRVLTTHAWKAPFKTLLAREKVFSDHFLWMYGYNYRDDCVQGQHAKLAIWHPKSDRGYLIGLLGDYALYTPWSPFEVEGLPFLLRIPHPITRIADTITNLTAKPEKLVMFLFRVNEDNSGELFDEKGSKFDFIGLQKCKDMPNFKAQHGIFFDGEATDASFFCGNGIPGTWNDSSSLSYEGRGQDGATGAVAFYNDTSGRLLPLGLYDYWIGSSGEPRFFTAFTKIFFDWLDDPPIPYTMMTTQPETGQREDEADGEYEYSDKNPEPSPRKAKTQLQPTPRDARGFTPPTNRPRAVFAEYVIVTITVVNYILQIPQDFLRIKLT